jgi:DeoR/GlpR family transcriptional regulator of sugar metabolism
MEAAIKACRHGGSKVVCAIADSMKWNQPSFAPIGPFGAVRQWIVDRGLPTESLDAVGKPGSKSSSPTDQDA